MPGMSFSWRLSGPGWATFAVADDQSEAIGTASYITTAPEDLLTAVARLVTGEAETQAQAEAEPTAYRWRFYRSDAYVRIQLLQMPYSRSPDTAGTEIWSSRQTTDALARAIIRAFDEVDHMHGEDGYHRCWQSPFPRHELENLRRLHRQAADSAAERTR